MLLLWKLAEKYRHKSLSFSRPITTWNSVNYQSLTIGLSRIPKCAYFLHTYDFRHKHVDTFAHFCPIFLKVIQSFSDSYKSMLFYFVFPLNRQILYCLHFFKETLLFNFSCKLFNKLINMKICTQMFFLTSDHLPILGVSKRIS